MTFRNDWYGVTSFAAIAIVLFFVGYHYSTIAIPDEDINVYVGELLFEDGRWWAPPSHRENDQYYKDKPPFYLWYFAIVAGYFGTHSTILLGLPSIISTGLMLYIIYIWVRTVRGPPAALYSVLITGTLPVFLFSAQTLRMDATMSVFIVAAFYSFWNNYSKKNPNYFWFFIFITAGIFVKGAPPIIVTIVPCTLFLLLHRRDQLPAFLFSQYWLVPLAGVGAWFFVVYLLYGFNPINGYVLEHTINRVTKGTVGPEQPWYYFANAFPYAVAPWFFLCLHGIYRGVNKNKKLMNLFLIWGVSGYLLFSLSTTKVFIYQLPLVIPFGVLGGLTITKLREKIQIRHIIGVHSMLVLVCYVPLLQSGMFGWWVGPLTDSTCYIIVLTFLVPLIQIACILLKKKAYLSFVAAHFLLVLFAAYAVTLPYLNVKYASDHRINWVNDECKEKTIYVYDVPTKSYLFLRHTEAREINYTRDYTTYLDNRPCIVTMQNNLVQNYTLKKLVNSHKYIVKYPPFIKYTNILSQPKHNKNYSETTVAVMDPRRGMTPVLLRPR